MYDEFYEAPEDVENFVLPAELDSDAKVIPEPPNI